MVDGGGLPPIERLTVRQRECLRLYAARYRVKEIAAAMGGISENTVGAHLTEAARTLGVGGRSAAAARLLAHEAAHPEARGRFSVSDPPRLAVPAVPAEQPTRAELPASDAAAGLSWTRLLPLRLSQGVPGDLSPPVRVLCILGLAVVLAFAFGQLAVGARLVSDVFSGLHPAR